MKESDAGMLPKVLVQPAVHCNRFFIHMTANDARLTFFEKLDDELSEPRAAVRLSHADLDDLAKLILQLRKHKES